MVAEEIVDEWYLTGRALNVSESKLKAIKSDSRLSGPEEKAVATMDTWADENGKQATILKLVEALYRRKKRSIIDSICREVQRDRPTSAASARDTVSSYHHTQGTRKQGITISSYNIIRGTWSHNISAVLKPATGIKI